MGKSSLESFYVQAACVAVVQASKVVSSLQFSELSISYKEDGSPVTKADLASNEIITNILADTHIPIISEEQTIPPWSVRSTWETFWVVDPLDGTSEYIRQSKQYSILIALIQNGAPKLGVVCTPALDGLYVGIPGESLWSASIGDFTGINSLRKFSRTLPPDVSKGYILLQSATQQSIEDAILQRCLQRKYQRVIVKKVVGVFKILDLICGKAHGYTRFGSSWIWDVAAGHALLQSAKMNLVDLQQNPIEYRKEGVQIQGVSLQI